MNHPGITLWFTGLSGAGKTTIALGVMQELKARNYRLEMLDGDVIRSHLSQDLGFSKEDRNINIRRLGFVASLLSRNGVVVIVAAITPYREIRNEIRGSTTNFVEVYVNAPLALCEARDVKGLYAKARAGLIKNFTGIDDPYEEPLHPEIICDTEKETVAESVAKVITELKNQGYIN